MDCNTITIKMANPDTAKDTEIDTAQSISGVITTQQSGLILFQ